MHSQIITPFFSEAPYRCGLRQHSSMLARCTSAALHTLPTTHNTRLLRALYADAPYCTRTEQYPLCSTNSCSSNWQDDTRHCPQRIHSHRNGPPGQTEYALLHMRPEVPRVHNSDNPALKLGDEVPSKNEPVARTAGNCNRCEENREIASREYSTVLLSELTKF